MKEYIDSILAAFGIIVTIFFQNRKVHKRICYLISKNKTKEEYRIFFWNASKDVITKEELNIYIIAPSNSKIIVEDSNDSIPLKVSREKYIDSMKGYSKYKLEVDFLCPYIGFVLKVENKDEKLNSKIGLLGRIKSENMYSVYYYSELKNKQNKLGSFFSFVEKPMTILEIIGYLFMIVFGFFLFFSSFFIMKVVSIVYVLFGTVSLISTIKRKKMPYKLKKIYKKQKDYTCISDLEKMIYYQGLSYKEIEGLDI